MNQLFIFGLIVATCLTAVLAAPDQSSALKCVEKLSARLANYEPESSVKSYVASFKDIDWDKLAMDNFETKGKEFESSMSKPTECRSYLKASEDVEDDIPCFMNVDLRGPALEALMSANEGAKLFAQVGYVCNEEYWRYIISGGYDDEPELSDAEMKTCVKEMSAKLAKWEPEYILKSYVASFKDIDWKKLAENNFSSDKVFESSMKQPEECYSIMKIMNELMEEVPCAERVDLMRPGLLTAFLNENESARIYMQAGFVCFENRPKGKEIIEGSDDE